MASKRHFYEILINGGSKRGESFCCSYDRVKDLMIRIGVQKIKASFSMTVLKDHSALIEEQRIFFNILNKAYLLHVLFFGCPLTIDSIEIIIDKETKRFTKDTSAGFPFVYSTLSAPLYDFDLPFLNGELTEAICNCSKSTANDDYRMVALFSFLSSFGKEFQIDRFTLLWTAMNAFYNYNALCYQQGVKQMYSCGDNQTLHKSLQLVGKDGLSIGATSWLLKKQYKPISADDAKKLFPRYCAVEKNLSHLTEEHIKHLYEESYRNLVEGHSMSDGFAELEKEIAVFGLPVFSFLLLGYPYYWRCRYLHGNHAPALFLAFNDPELDSLRVMNYFMKRYLTENLRLMFRDDYWDDEKTECVLDYMALFSDGAKKKIDKHGLFTKKESMQVRKEDAR